MSTIKNIQLGAHVIMYAVMNDKQGVVKLLNKNGVAVSVSDPNEVISQSVVALLKSSKTFRQEFMDFLLKHDLAFKSCNSYSSANGEFANAGGTVNPFTTISNESIGLNTLPSGGSFTPTSETATTTTAPAKAGSWFNAQNISSSLNTALNAFLTLDKNKTDRELAKSGVVIAQSQSGSGVGSGGFFDAPTAQKSNTVLYVILGVLGVAVVGTVIYFATKKK